MDINPETGFPRGSLEDQIRQEALKLPKKDWDRVPKDLGENLDHYLYGTPRR